MKEKNKKLLIGIIIGIIVIGLVGSFIIDLGINSKFFIKRNFNQAFTYRVTGDCDAFANYFSLGVEKWNERCEEEKSRDKEPIRNFQIQNISHRFGSNRAFLQVELTRNVSGKEDYSYSVNYEMKKFGFDWKINQEINK